MISVVVCLPVLHEYHPYTTFSMFFAKISLCRKVKFLASAFRISKVANSNCPPRHPAWPRTCCAPVPHARPVSAVNGMSLDEIRWARDVLSAVPVRSHHPSLSHLIVPWKLQATKRNQPQLKCTIRSTQLSPAPAHRTSSTRKLAMATNFIHEKLPYDLTENAKWQIVDKETISQRKTSSERDEMTRCQA